MIAQSAIAVVYQMAMKGMVSLEQLNAYAAAPSPPARTPAKAPQGLKRVGAPLRRDHITAANGIAAKNIMQSRQRAGET